MTLTEVLMSLMIMGIGIVSVATLFPISTLRTLEANKATNTTITRFNAEAVVDVNPSFVHNPDGVFPNPALPPDQDQTPYNGLSFRGQMYLVDPLGWQTANENNPQPASPATIALRDYFGNTPPLVVNLPLPRRYTGATMFPLVAGTISPYPNPASPTEIQNAVGRAVQLVVQPDNWKIVTEAVATASTPAAGVTSVTLDVEADLSSVTVPATAYPKTAYRVTIFDREGLRSEIRTPTVVNAGTGQIDWSPTAPLPALFNGNVGKVRVEQSDEIYSWMLSVRKRPSGPANVDVVVFFKRNFNPDHELVFDAEFRRYDLGAGNLPGGPGDDNGVNGANDPGEIGFPGSDDTPNNRVTIKVPSSTNDDQRPKARRGGYIYDTKNGLWYRIRSVENELTVGAEDWLDVLLDEAIKLDNTEDVIPDGVLTATPAPPAPLTSYEDRNGDGRITRGGAVVHPNVVNVFPLEIKEP